MESLSGAVVDQKYRLSRLLGEGGMGVVYEAEDLRDGSLVAVKILRGTLPDPAARLRFEREARALYELRHESLVRVLDYAAHPSHAYFVMELAPGVNLSELCDIEGPLQSERVAKIALAVLGALGAAHARGIVHRDVKPQNIQVSALSTGGDAVRLLDFGLAKDLASGHALTQEGMVVGTMQYMAPEQAKGRAVDPRADVYAVGACMYYALTGRRPFEGHNGLPLYRAVVSEAPRSLASLRTDLSPMLIAIVERALAKDPNQRFRSAEDLARALASYLAQLAAPSASSNAVTPSYRGHTVPLFAAAMMGRASQPSPSRDLSNEITIRKPALPLAPPDTPVPDTTPSGPPGDACPPTKRSSGKGALLAGVFVLVGLVLAVGSAAMVRAGGPSRLHAALPR